MSPSGRRGRQAKNTLKSVFVRTLNGNLPWFIRLINFSLQATENYEGYRSEDEDHQGQKGEEKPDGPAEHLVAGLSDAEGSKEGSREGLRNRMP